MEEEAVLPRRGTVFVLSAPSGAGKSTVIEAVLQGQSRIRRCITVTTRPPAPGEVDGVDYVFRSVEEFRHLEEQGELLESAQVHGNCYGTPRWWVVEQIEQGIDVVLVIDVQGARQIRERLDRVVTIFLAPPSLAELERRLRARGREPEEAIATRLHNAAAELRCIPDYDYLVINEDLDRAVAEVGAILTAERLRVRPGAETDAVLRLLLEDPAQLRLAEESWRRVP